MQNKKYEIKTMLQLAISRSDVCCINTSPAALDIMTILMNKRL